MNAPLISILIPTRWRVPDLLKCMRSIVDTADDTSRFEFQLRIDNDDPETIAAIPDIEAIHKAVKIWIGSKKGWGGSGLMYSQMGYSTESKWLWCFNDDAEIQGKGWDTMIANAPLEGVFVAPEHWQLGGSKYLHVLNTIFALLPNRIWERFNLTSIPEPTDAWSYETLVHQEKWLPYWLNGITICHWRKNDRLIANDKRF